MQPVEAPDAFASDEGAWGGAGYDTTIPSNSRAWEKEQGSFEDRSHDNRSNNTKPVINYAGPGSSSNSMNPASTVSFMLNMGYPPPPIALEPLRRLVEQVTAGHGNQLNVHNALFITDEITRSPHRVGPAVLFVIQQRLHSSKPDRVSLALELLDMCVKNCGLDFIRHINKEFMKSISAVIKTTSFKERTFTGQMKRLEKYITGAPTNVGIATDPRVHKLRLMCLTMIQNWVEAFSKYTAEIAPVFDAYDQLKRKGIQFPPKDINQRYMIKDSTAAPIGELRTTGDSLGGGGVASPRWEDESRVGSPQRMEAFGNDPLDEKLPLSDKQFQQIESFVQILRNDLPGTQKVEDVLNRCTTLRSILEIAYRDLNTRVQASSSRKLRCSNPAVMQLNVLMSLDAEYKKRRGTRLLFESTPDSTAAVSPAISGGRPAFHMAPPPPPPPPPAPPKPINLLDDLLDEEEKIAETKAAASKACVLPDQQPPAVPRRESEDDTFNTSIW